MCGLILWMPDRPDDANTDITDRDVDRYVAAVARRGPHSHGWSYLGTDSRWTTTHAAGPLTAPVPGRWRLAIGHSRLATSGSGAGGMPPADEAQPIERPDGLVIAHNGVVPRWEEPGAPDSHRAAAWCVRLEDIPSAFASPARGNPQAVIAADASGRVLLWRAGRHGGHPLFWTETVRGTFVTSARVDDASTLIPAGATWTPPPSS